MIVNLLIKTYSGTATVAGLIAWLESQIHANTVAASIHSVKSMHVSELGSHLRLVAGCT